jgi:hypothetical protein
MNWQILARQTNTKKEKKTSVKSDLGEAGILPDGELVLAEAVAGDELPVLCVPHDGGDLATRVHTLQLVHAARVPHPVHKHTVRGAGSL